MARIVDSLPSLYSQFLPDIFSAEQVNESKATCDDCAMCETSKHSEAEARRHTNFPMLFSTGGKCCTFFPSMPNYLVGGLLADTTPELAEGRRRMLERIHGRTGVTPSAIGSSAVHKLLYEKKDPFVFGNPDAVLCPYYAKDTGLCTIWRFRGATCSTYFCKHDAGKDGVQYWRALKDFLGMIEWELSVYALWKVAPALARALPTPQSAEHLSVSSTQITGRPPSDGEYAALWSDWEGREAELYKACHAVVSALTPEEFKRVVGGDGLAFTSVVEHAYQKVVNPPKLPEVLTFNPEVVVKFRPGGEAVLSGYSMLDGVPMPAKAFWVLRAELSGLKPLEAARPRLKEADISDELLLNLVRMDVLRAA